ncbi:beta-ketoadipyl CoA thiolase [Shewanella halifaxensis HAW-EB4]|uniref:Beta-ketoadipyl-CoA thiolase n=1 Tax=Shewanella halifaxensis (strain HAW-EB4) TaxID=458817 RepID=B0TNJ3_SHEHH|nr:3-oxoadipyl-CoA thiolase [Shewanella halifaxensis]ABZ77507.1 beta-ketoadipyl CoA thiolase [Shewanella halifaxensis HAW-EB4]
MSLDSLKDVSYLKDGYCLKDVNCLKDVYICDAIRTPIGRYGSGLSSVRADDLAALPIKALIERNPDVDWQQCDDLLLGCANQSGEDNRNIARMAGLLAGLPVEVPGCTVNRLCGSGLNALGDAARAIRTGEADLMIAGGVESMSRAPFVMPKATSPFARSTEFYDTTMGWRFINPEFDKHYGTEAMPQTAENLAQDFAISREAQDRFALWSQQKAASAQEAGLFDNEIVPVTIPVRRGEPTVFSKDEHLRLSSLEKLSSLKPLFDKGAITAGNASGINDGAAALLLASAEGVVQHKLKPRAKILGMAVAGVPPRVMGLGPVPATNKLLKRLNLSLDDMDLLEFNEAFAAQALTCIRELGLKDDDPRINPQGGAIALGHPLGMSGARLATTAVNQLERTQGRYALCTMCVGVGQGIAMIIERVS